MAHHALGTVEEVFSYARLGITASNYWLWPGDPYDYTKPFGPADSFRLEFVEDNPGHWFYHCHVFTHFHMGMNGWYIVD